MKKIISLLLAIVLCICFFPNCCLGELAYLIPDSNTRYLTYEELWKWDYESLGYILNEIFARHGYVFEEGGKYDYYFSCMPWYSPNTNSNNSVACYPKLNQIEWANEALVKDVRQEMRNLNDYNRNGKSVWDYFSTGFSTLRGFDYVQLKTGQKINVYSAPNYSSWRGSNGKARVSTNGNIYSAGWEGNWLLIMYETNNGSVRVGYINKGDIQGRVPISKLLSFSYIQAQLVETAELTDDPAKCYQTIVRLPSGTKVTYLSTFYNNNAWDYIETTINGQTVRGFIRSGSLNYNEQDRIADDYSPNTTPSFEDAEG